MNIKIFIKIKALFALSFFSTFSIYGYCYEQSLIELEPSFYKEMTESGTLISLTLNEKMNLRIGPGTVFRFRILMPPGVKGMFVNTESNQWSIGGMDNPRFGIFETDPGPMQQPTFGDLPNVGAGGLGLMLQRNNIPIEQATNAYFIGYNPTTTPFEFGTFSVMMPVENVGLYSAWYNARRANGSNYEGIGEIFKIASNVSGSGKNAFVFNGINITNDTTAKIQYNDEGTGAENYEIVPNQFVTLKSTIYPDSQDIGLEINGFIIVAVWGNAMTSNSCYSGNNVFQFKVKDFFRGESWTEPTKNLPTHFSLYPLYTRESLNSQISGNILNIGENALLTPLDGFNSLCFFTGYVTQRGIIGEFSEVFKFKNFESFPTWSLD